MASESIRQWAGDVFQVVFPGVAGGTVVCVYYVTDDGTLCGEAAWEPPADARAKFKNPQRERPATIGGGWVPLEPDGTFVMPANAGGNCGGQTFRLAVPIRHVNTLTQCHLQKVDWVSLKMVGARIIKPAKKGGAP